MRAIWGGRGAITYGPEQAGPLKVYRTDGSWQLSLDSLQAAELADAIHQELGTKDGAFAAWIKRQRDEYPREDPAWRILDRLLDDCRLHWVTGTPLTDPTPSEGGHDDE